MAVSVDFYLSKLRIFLQKDKLINNIFMVCTQGIELKNQTIPSGVYSALEEAGITDSILYGYNDVNLRWVGKDNWTYSLVFDGAVYLLR